MSDLEDEMPEAAAAEEEDEFAGLPEVNILLRNTSAAFILLAETRMLATARLGQLHISTPAWGPLLSFFCNHQRACLPWQLVFRHSTSHTRLAAAT